MVRVPLRTVTLRIPPQEVITRDNVQVRVAAVSYFRVIDPRRAVLDVEDYMAATLQIAQTTLRSSSGRPSSTLCSPSASASTRPSSRSSTSRPSRGHKVTIVEIKDVEIPERMQQALARQAEAERNRRAKVINAEGEFQAADRLSQAANVIRPNPVTLQLRYIQALTDISSNAGTTIVFPLPMDLLKPLLEGHRDGEAASDQPAPPSGEERALPGDEPRALPPSG